MTELRVSHLIDEVDEMLDNKFHVGSYCLFMNTDDIQDVLSKIKAILPEEIKTAEMILKRRDDIYRSLNKTTPRSGSFQSFQVGYGTETYVAVLILCMFYFTFYFLGHFKIVHFRIAVFLIFKKK